MSQPPSPSHSLEAIEHDFTLLVRQLEALSRQRSYPLERAYYLVLCTLSRMGPMTPGALAQSLALDNSTITRQIVAMERLQLVMRRRSAQDARSVEVTATDHGLALAEQMRSQRLIRMGQMLSRWNEDDLRSLGQQLGRLNIAIREQIDRVNTDSKA